MKHIKCYRCGELVRPPAFGDHQRKCGMMKEDDVTEESENQESPPKRQKVSEKATQSVNAESATIQLDSTSEFPCSRCQRRFSRKRNLRRHETTCQGTVELQSARTMCGICKRTFKSYRSRLGHEKVCKTRLDAFRCTGCGEHFSSGQLLVEHEQTYNHNNPCSSGNSCNSSSTTRNTRPNKFRKSNPSNVHANTAGRRLLCRMCGDRFEDYPDLYSHRMFKHKQSNAGNLQDDPWTSTNETPPWVNEDGSENEQFRLTYDQHRHLILRGIVREGEVRSSFNFPLPDLLDVNQLMSQIEYIFERSQNSFKINLSFGLILQNTENGAYRFFSPHYTDGVFLFPQLINNRSDIERLRLHLSKLDIPNYFHKQRPDSKWRPVLITNVLYNIFKVAFPLGAGTSLPSYIINSKSIVSFGANPNSNKIYDDSLCFFRCLAYHRSRSVYCEKLASTLFTEWVQYVYKNKLKSTDVTLQKMPDLEQCFETNISVYELAEDTSVTILYKSREVYSNENSCVMKLNLFEDHLSYISKFNSYAKKFQCRMCTRLFDRQGTVTRHEKTCLNSTKLRLPGGYFSKDKSVFDKLKDLGINVPVELQSYPWFATFDMEAILKPEVKIDDSEEHLQKTSLHEPVSVSVCSNVVGFNKPSFFVDPNTDSLMSQLFSYLNDISNKTNELAVKRWDFVFKEFEKLESIWGRPPKRKHASDSEIICNSQSTKDDYNDDDDDDDDECDDDDDDDNNNEIEAMETNKCEPPSAEFLHALSKENVWFQFLKNIENTGNVEVNYNDWEIQSSLSNHSSSSSSSRSSSSSSSSSRSGSRSRRSSSCSRSSRMRRSRSSCRSGSSSSSSSSSRSCSSSRMRRRSSSSSSRSSSDKDDDNLVLPFKPLNSRKYINRIDSDSEEEEEEEEENDVDSVDVQIYIQTRELMAKLICRTREQFETYCHQIPVLGFNSAKYDLNIVKTKLAKHMNLDKAQQTQFVVKKNNAYMCIANKTLRLLDLTSYLPPGTSYEKFLHTFGVSQKKAFFPYEYFTDISVLDETSLPPKEAFYSNLKRCNVLEDPVRVKYERLTLSELKTTNEALSLLDLVKIPESKIDENYQTVLNIWKENKMQSFKDYLRYYNNLDVMPMCEGIEKFKSYFTEKGIDIFKDCISVPGAARKLLYQSGFKRQASFSLLSRADEDLYHTFKSNIFGGPSIIFTRYHEKGCTNIRENENIPCQSVLGLDANSLYLHSIGQPMPCGNYVRRTCENGFRPVKNSNRFIDMYDWLDFLSINRNLDIKHKMNHGYEKRIGPYLVDGYDSNSNTVFEFLGCYYHSHDCTKWSDEKVASERANRTKERLEYIKSLGYNVQVVWECEYKHQVNSNSDLQDFILKRQPTFYLSNKGKVSEDQILQGVLDDSLFGMIECDIRVPDNWEQVKFRPKTDLTPYEYFEEMCPLFCTTEVDFDYIGSHMQQHVENYNLSKNPRTLLVGGLRAEKILIASPLLKWYISHGLLISKIHQVVEFSKLACFKDFVDSITNDRRKGDIEKSQELKGTLSKLIGNSAFGGTIINQEKFQKVKYVKGFKKACFAVNNPRFREINEFGDGMFECLFANANISIKTPIYLGYMILQYAKLHMLAFYYDFLDRFVDRRHFEMIEMDTDSCYFALSSKTLENAVKPEMLKVFTETLEDKMNCRDNFNGDSFTNVWFPRLCCEKHTLFDSRTPGLMKVEFTGTKMIGLNSKSYIGVNKPNDDTGHITSIKYSLKGVNNYFCNPINQFEQVLNSSQTLTAVNTGIRSFHNTVYTYTQPKKAFTYFYCKRVVQSDGIHTKPLNIILKPVNKWKNDRELEMAELLSSLL